MFRQIHTTIWTDSYFLDLSPSEKLLFIYMFSNGKTSLSGLYEISIKQICFETCLDADFVIATLAKLEAGGKVFYQDGVAYVRNMRKYHTSKSRTVQERCRLDVLHLAHSPLKEIYDMDTLSIGYAYPIGEIEKETEEKIDEKTELNTDTDANGEVDPSIASAYKAYHCNIGELTGRTKHDIRQWCNTFGSENVLSAIMYAVEQNKRSSGYIFKTLQGRRLDGII